jgi:hypothetical protein
MKHRWRMNRFVVGMTLGVTLVTGCAARQPESPPGLATAEQQTASAASRAEQAAQRAEATAATLEGQFARRLRK